MNFVGVASHHSHPDGGEGGEGGEEGIERGWGGGEEEHCKRFNRLFFVFMSSHSITYSGYPYPGS